MFTMLDSHVQHTIDLFAYIQGQITALSSQIDNLSVDHGSDLESDQFQPFGHSSQKGGENLQGECAQFQGEHSLGLKTLVHSSGLPLFILAFITDGLLFLLFQLKVLVLCFYNSVLYSVFVFTLLLCSIFQYFQILLICLKYLTLVPQQDIDSQIQILRVFCIG